MTRRAMLATGLLAGLLFDLAPAMRAQETQVLLPAQSAAKAKELIQGMIQGLGGSAYLGVRDSTCTGKLSLFGHAGDLTDYETFYDYQKLPDKDRTEHGKKRNIIEIYNRNQGWVLDRGGVSDAPAEVIKQNQEDLQVDFDYVLRYRLNEPGMIFRYDGPDVVDLKEADWVEIVDPQDRTIRIAIAKLTHLPIEKVVITRAPTTHLRDKQVEYYSNFHPIDGVEAPFQITRFRNDQKVFQVFFDKCQYNTGLSDSLFTKESLEGRWSQIGKKHKKNKD